MDLRNLIKNRDLYGINICHNCTKNSYDLRNKLPPKASNPSSTDTLDLRQIINCKREIQELKNKLSNS